MSDIDLRDEPITAQLDALKEFTEPPGEYVVSFADGQELWTVSEPVAEANVVCLNCNCGMTVRFGKGEDLHNSNEWGWWHLAIIRTVLRYVTKRVGLLRAKQTVSKVDRRRFWIRCEVCGSVNLKVRTRRCLA